jgi:hypothetical protein
MAQNRPPLHIILFDVIRIGIALGYIVLGAFFIFSEQINHLILPGIAPYFGGALIAYGAFRMFRAFLLLKDRLAENAE